MASTDSNKTSYVQLMEGIAVTPEMRSRVLAGVAAALESAAPEMDETELAFEFEPEVAAAEPEPEPSPEPSPEPEPEPAPRKSFQLFLGGRPKTSYLAAAACLLVALVVGVALLNGPLAGDDLDGDANPAPIAAVNGMAELASAEELAAAVGVPVPAAAALEAQAASVAYVSLWGEIAEIDYELADNVATLRIAPVTGDNSGDYEAYSIEETFDYGDVTVTLKGAEGGYQLALWDQGKLGVSLRFNEPVSRDTLVSCVESVIDGMPD